MQQAFPAAHFNCAGQGGGNREPKIQAKNMCIQLQMKLQKYRSHHIFTSLISASLYHVNVHITILTGVLSYWLIRCIQWKPSRSWNWECVNKQDTYSSLNIYHSWVVFNKRGHLTNLESFFCPKSVQIWEVGTVYWKFKKAVDFRANHSQIPNDPAWL